MNASESAMNDAPSIAGLPSDERPETEMPSDGTRPPMRTRLLSLGVRVGLGAALFTGVVGLLHLPAAAPVLRMLSPASVCPLMRGTPAQIDRAHAIGAAAIRSSASAPAPSRPALVFRLDETRKGDLDAWATDHGVTCKSIAGNETLQRCTAVPASAIGEPEPLGALEEVTFEFRSTGELVNVQTLRRHLTPEQAAHAAEHLERNAEGALGTPTTSAGTPSVAHLSRGVLSTYVAVHTFEDYRATVSATNLSPTGMMVREEYLSTR